MAEGIALFLFVGAVILLVRKRPCRTTWQEDMEWHMNEYIHQLEMARIGQNVSGEDYRRLAPSPDTEEGKP